MNFHIVNVLYVIKTLMISKFVLLVDIVKDNDNEIDLIELFKKKEVIK